MKQLLITTVSILTLSLSVFSQDQEEWLVKKIKAADSVILVSHNLTSGVGVVDSMGKLLSLPKLIIAGKPNYAICIERQIINGSLLDSFIKILCRPFQDSIIEGAKCFIPHNAVFLIKKGKTSYIDICFGCRQFDTSKDLTKLYAFDNRKWTELENLYLKLGFKYELYETQ